MQSLLYCGFGSQLVFGLLMSEGELDLGIKLEMNCLFKIHKLR